MSDNWAPAPRQTGFFGWPVPAAEPAPSADALDDLFGGAAVTPAAPLPEETPAAEVTPVADTTSEGAEGALGLTDLFGPTAPSSLPVEEDPSGLTDLFGTGDVTISTASESDVITLASGDTDTTADATTDLMGLFGGDDFFSSDTTLDTLTDAPETPVETSATDTLSDTPSSVLDALSDAPAAISDEPAPKADDTSHSTPAVLSRVTETETTSAPPKDIPQDEPVAETPADPWSSVPLPIVTVEKLTDPEKVSEDTPEPVSLSALTANIPLPEPKAAPRKGRLAAAQELINAASEFSTADIVADEAARLRHTLNITPDYIWSYADRVLGLVSSSPSIQSVVNRMVLTRDTALDAYQRREFQNAITPHLLGNTTISINNPMDVAATFDIAYDELIGLSILGPLWRDEEVTEILIDGWNKIAIEKGGVLIPTPLSFRDKEHANRVARELASKVSDRALTPSNPLVTALLPGARINFAYGPVVATGLSVSLRKFRDLLGVEKLLQFGALSPDMAEFLRQAVIARATVLVSGGTGTGKTTQINALSQWIPDTERVVTIEDAFELQLSNTHVVSLQTKEKASADDQVVITQEDLLVNALRMRPDRIVVGEIREGRGANVMLQAANTGHDGTMTTIHANSPSVALNERLADLVMEVSSVPSAVIRRTVANAIDLVVQVTRKRGRRFISEIALVDRSCYQEAAGSIIPDPIFVGDLALDGTVTFRHVGAIRPDTALAEKMAESGLDYTAWEPTR